MKLISPRKYFFGYLFVRLAKGIAVLIVIIAFAFVVFKYAQASNSANAATYRSSVALDQRLEKLRVTFERSARLVTAFNSGAEAAKLTAPRFPRPIDHDADFEAVRARLAKVDQDRGQMKQLVIDRFESAAADIEKRLRDHAASLRAGASPPPTSAPMTTPNPTPVTIILPISKEEQETLFSRTVNKGEIDDRFARLEAVKTFLSGLETKAENLENRKKLFDSVTEIEALKKLLPVRLDYTLEPQPSATPATQSPAESAKMTEARTLAKAEEVANKLAAHRAAVREAMLNSWAIDEVFDESSELAGVESNKCQSASLIVSGIWLAAVAQMVTALIASVFLAFLILVMADLTQTLLDTATNTGVMAQDGRPNQL
jgi:hypothetical protein